MTMGITFPFSSGWQKITISYTDLQVAALTKTVTIRSLPAKGVVQAAIVNVTTAFAGTTTCSLSVGIPGNLVKYVVATTILGTGIIIGTSIAPDLESSSIATNIQIQAIATVLNLSSLSQGAADIYLLMSNVP